MRRRQMYQRETKQQKYSSSKTCCVDRLSPFHFKLFDAPGRTIGIADYLSRHTSQVEEENLKPAKL